MASRRFSTLIFGGLVFLAFPGFSHAQATATTDASLSTELAHEMQQIEYNEGGYIIPFFPPVIDGFGTNVGGLVPSKIGLSLNAYDFKGVWLS